MRIFAGLVAAVLGASGCLLAQERPAVVPVTAPATKATEKLPFISVDVPHKRLVVECTAINARAALEFLCVTEGTNEHEAILKTKAKPSNIHLGLLMLGMTPGTPVRFSEAADKWLPPQGPPIQISAEFEKSGQKVTVPAWKLFRDMKDKKPMPPRTWIFVGSKVLDQGQYAADITGYVVSIVNFDLSLMDVPWLASSSNELLEYEVNPDVIPADGTPVKMIIEPAGAVATSGAAGPSPTTAPIKSSVSADQAKIDRLRDQWKQGVASHAREVQDAAAEHYRIITELRAEQNRLIDEAERVGRVVDQLEKQYQDITVPRPAAGKSE